MMMVRLITRMTVAMAMINAQTRKVPGPNCVVHVDVGMGKQRGT
jgi:hypothetical protein